MNPDLLEAKKQLRIELRGRVKSISPPGRISASVRLCEILRQQEIWKVARTILLYAPLPDEPDVSPLLFEALAAHKIVALPRFDLATNCYTVCQIKDPILDLTAGKFGIREPNAHAETFPLNQLDFALVPGVGFSFVGARLGRGRGFYDRLLAQMRGMKCGVAFDEQIIENIPAASHDMRMNFILTPTRWQEAT